MFYTYLLAHLFTFFVYSHTYAKMFVRKSEDIFVKSLLSFHSTGSVDLIQVIGLGSLFLFLLSHLTGPKDRYLNKSVEWKYPK